MSNFVTKIQNDKNDITIWQNVDVEPSAVPKNGSKVKHNL